MNQGRLAAYHAFGEPAWKMQDLGMLKLLVSTEDRTLLGVHVFGTNAADLVHFGQAVMGCGGTVDYLADTVFNYLTLCQLPDTHGGMQGGCTGHHEQDPYAGLLRWRALDHLLVAFGRPEQVPVP